MVEEKTEKKRKGGDEEEEEEIMTHQYRFVLPCGNYGSKIFGLELETRSPPGTTMSITVYYILLQDGK